MHRRGDLGFGILEIAVAFAVIMTAVIPIGYLLTNVLGQSASARLQIAALGVAEKWTEILTNEGPPVNSSNQPIVGSTIPETSSINTVPGVGVTFTVGATFNWDTVNGTATTPCASGTVPILDLIVTASWNVNSSGQATSHSHGTASDATTLAFPPSGVQNNGFLAVQVNGYPTANPPNDFSSTTFATRVQTESVSAEKVVNGVGVFSSTVSVSPSSSGCALLEVGPGAWTVTVNPPVGGTTCNGATCYVCNNSEVAEPYSPYTTSNTAEVDQALITNVNVQCDEGADVNLNYPSTSAIQDGVTCPNTTTVGCLAVGESSTSGSQTPDAAIAGYTGTTRSWNVGTGLSSLLKVNGTACTAGTTNMCVAVGYNSSGNAEVAYAPSSTPNTWTASQISNSGSPIAEAITQVTCPTATECFAITDPQQNSSGATASGSSPAYILEGAVTASSVTWTVASVGTGISAINQSQITTLTQLVCAGTASCFALGTSTISGTTGALVMGTTTTASGVTWLNDTPVLSTLLSNLLSLLGLLGDHLGTSTLTQMVCPTGQSECLVVGEAVELNLLGINLGVAGWSLDVSNTNPSSWTVLNLPSGLPSSLALLSSFSSITCDPTGAQCVAVLSTFAGNVYVLSTPGAANLLSWTLDTLPSGVDQIDQVVCTGSSVECFATASGGYTSSPPGGAQPPPTHLLNLPTGSSTWSKDTGVPTAISTPLTAGTGFYNNHGTNDDNGIYGTGSNIDTANNGLYCNATTCFAYGATSAGGFIMSLGSTSGTPAWTSDTLPSTSTATTTQFVSGVGCQGSTTTCLATGGSETSGQLLDYSSATTTWSLDSASSSLVGAYQTGLPIEIFQSGLQPSTTLEDWAPAASTTTDDSQIGPLFPFSNYGVGAGDCPAGDTHFTSNATPSITPGDVNSNAVSDTIPLGLLAIQATNTSGVPISGATIAVAIDTASGYDTSCATTLTPLNGGTNPSSWTLINSGADGFSRLAVMYQTYSVTVTVGATHATHVLQVTPTAVIDSTNSASPVTYPLPGVVKIAD